MWLAAALSAVRRVATLIHSPIRHMSNKETPMRNSSLTKNFRNLSLLVLGGLVGSLALAQTGGNYPIPRCRSRPVRQKEATVARWSPTGRVAPQCCAAAPIALPERQFRSEMPLPLRQWGVENGAGGCEIQGWQEGRPPIEIGKSASWRRYRDRD